ncbi:hypothetical protein B0T14DRAFT_602434 [Immersiella caudata]|uniref:Tyrosinase copper-binding domain-containing protein n=1 Tax=Immersiella caudata TaxID=314043 RepID=A0AA40C3S3_9PEZI|nr:hypothetical protein B0T14DRAFT_602434 [Immersiella caudata]
MQFSNIFFAALAATSAMAAPAPQDIEARQANREIRIILQNQSIELGGQEVFIDNGNRQTRVFSAGFGPIETVELKLGAAVDPQLRCAIVDPNGRAITVIRGANVDVTFGDGLAPRRYAQIVASGEGPFICSVPSLLPRQRKSWFSATNTEKQAYIDAVLCLSQTPARLNVWDHRRLPDGFSYVHAHLSYPTDKKQTLTSPHSPRKPQLPPLAPLFVSIYEKALQDNCGYTGMAMYWGVEVKPHYLSCNWRIENLFANGYTPEEMEWVYNQTTYDGFRNQLENYPHSAVHVGVGGGWGDVGTQVASTNDPLFFLHHTQVDRI